MEQKTQEQNNITFMDIYRNEIKKLYCQKEISTLPHHKKGYCLSCAIKRGLLK